MSNEVVTNNMSTDIDILDFESMGMTPQDMKDFFHWALGTSSEPPEVVQKMMVNLSTKLSVGMGINIVGNIGRQTRLTKFLEDMEKEIYDSSRISMMTEKEKMTTYKEARATLNALSEMQRKFIVQNKETFNPQMSDQEKLMGRIMALPKDKLAKIVSILDDDANVQSENTEVIDAVFPDHIESVLD